MTRDEILAMEPGRELDALVAEKVMGWTVKFMDGIWGWMYRESERNRWYNVPRFTTDISAAWEVVEKMQSWGGCDIGCFGRTGDGTWYVVETHTVNGCHKATCHTAPEAICNAALLASIE
jgi:hypothetical protein